MSTASVRSSRYLERGKSAVEQRIFALQIATVAWMLVECSVALTAAWLARSVSLLAFGSDSFVELLSAVVVLLPFTASFRISQAKAARICGALLFVLAGVVSLVALFGISEHIRADSSLAGMVITAGALCLMPILARYKRKAAEATGNRALRADAVQSATCAYLAALTLGGLLLRLAFAIEWVDQAAALLAVPILIVEGRRARRGETCACC